MKTLIDSYSEANQNSEVFLNNANSKVGQSFTGQKGYLKSCTWFLSKTATLGGMVVAKVYEHSGTFGSSSLPTGTPIATSNSLRADALKSFKSLVTFDFPGIVLLQDRKYVLTLEYANGTASNQLAVGIDVTSSAHAGNALYYDGSWHGYASYDFCFNVHTTDFNKRYEYKLYEPDGTYLTTITDITDEVRFTSYINAGLGEFTFRLPRSIFSFDETVTIAQNNQLKVVCHDDNQSETVIYSGYISKYAPVLDKGRQYITVTCLSFLTELERFMLEDASGNTTLAYSSQDPSAILSDIMSKYAAAGGTVTASTVVDQTLGSTDLYRQFETYTWLSQPFIPTKDYLKYIGVSLKKTGSPTGNLTIEIQTDSSNAPSGTVIATATLDVATFGTAYTQYVLATECAVTPGEKYHVCLKGQTAWTTANDVHWGYLSGAGFEPAYYGAGAFTSYGQTRQYSLITYYNPIRITGTVVTYEFNTYSVKEALDKVVELAPNGWHYFVDAYNVLHFEPKSTEPDHVFVLGKDVISIVPEKSVENLCNRLYFTGGEVAGTPLYKKYERASSIATYGLYSQKMIDSRITDETTMDIIAAAYLDRLDAPETRTTVELRDLGADGRGYDIESIRPGQTCKVIGYDNKASNLWDQAIFDVDKWDYDITQVSSTTQQIMKVSYAPHKVILEISSTLPNISHRVEDIKRNLNRLQTNDNPSAPTT